MQVQPATRHLVVEPVLGDVDAAEAAVFMPKRSIATSAPRAARRSVPVTRPRRSGSLIATAARGSSPL